MVFTNRLLAYRQPEYVESNQFVSAILQKHLEQECIPVGCVPPAH